MLSIFAIGSAKQAGSYYEQDNYYVKNSEESQAASNWYGKGAHALDLSGPVDKEQFVSLLEGKLPSGQQLGKIENGQIKHIPGYDLTFSAPKSASILALVGGDKRIIEAHKKAVQTTLNYLEKHSAQTRVVNEDKIERITTGNWIIAQFHHDTSRELEPQLHTHNIIQNMTQKTDGQWRSITGDVLYQNMMLGGMIYRSEFAKELKSLGYELVIDHQKGTFEIKNVPQIIIDLFSTRREQIEERLKEKGVEGAKAAEIATLDTRQSKQDANRDDLQAIWLQQCKENGFDIAQNYRADPTHENTTQPSVYDSVQFAIAHLSEKEATFHEKAILKEALAHGMGSSTVIDIEKALNHAKSNLLIEKGQGLWTTPQALAMEKAIIEKMHLGQGQVKSVEQSVTDKNWFDKMISLNFASKDNNCVSSFLSKQSLTAGQKAAAEMILTTRNRIVGIQGYAGTGKTYMLSTVREYAESNGFKLIGLSPKASAAKELEMASGIHSQTLSSFLHGQTEANHKSIIILDESSMASNKQLLQLIAQTEGVNARLVLVGDSKQLGAIEAGKPFEQLQKAGMQTEVMKDILRQENKTLLSAVKDSIKGDVKSAMEKLEGNIVEVSNKQERLAAVANTYLSLSSDEREKTLVLAPANADRNQLNIFIREGLKAEGKLHGAGVQFESLVNKRLSHAQSQQIKNYQVSDLIRSNSDYKSLGLKKGEYFKITQIDQKKHLLHLTNEKGKTVQFDPFKLASKKQGAIEVYQQQNKELIVGDTIQWLRNDYSRGLRNSETAIVEKISQNTAKLRLENGKQLTIDLRDMNTKHWDYAYTSTVHSAQGKTCDRVLVHAESTNAHLTNQRSFYVELSRAKHEAKLFTDNKEQLTKTIEKHTGEKTSALEQELPKSKGTSSDKTMEASL